MGALEELKARVEGHTPGPWEFNSPGVCCEGTCIDSRNGDVQHDMSVIRWRDALLIAAAPKLLAALEAVVTEMGMNAREYRRTADALNLQVIDRDPDRDAEAAARYASYASSWEAAELAVQRAIEEALR